MDKFNPMIIHVGAFGSKFLNKRKFNKKIVAASVPDVSGGVPWGPSLVGPHQRRPKNLAKRGPQPGVWGETIGGGKWGPGGLPATFFKGP